MLPELARLLVLWRPAFPRHITWVRLASVLLGLIVAVGRRTVTSSIAARGRKSEPWAADYLVFSRASWEVSKLFDGVTTAVVSTRARFCAASRYLMVAIDDTSVRKTGKTINSARWYRDPMSPPFHVNLRFGLRYVHLAAILPLHHVGLDPRAVSVAFVPAPSVKKPGKKATAEQVSEFKEAKKKQNLCTVAVEQVKHLREHLDAIGQHSLLVLVLGDGSYTNRTMLRNLPERTEYLGRCRGNMALCSPAPAGGRKFYGERLPTPDEVRQDPEKPWTETGLFYAGKVRKVRFKEMPEVLWQSGAQKRLLRVLIVAPTPYKAPGRAKKRWYYREPAFLLTTDLTTPAEELIQAYLARWQIEVEHRDQKTGLGVGQAQVYNDKAVARLHSAYVAMWSMVKLAALRTYGLTRTDDYPARPAWYPQEPNDRASQEDIVETLRSEIHQHQPQPACNRLRSPRPKRQPPVRKRLTVVRELEAA